MILVHSAVSNILILFSKVRNTQTHPVHFQDLTRNSASFIPSSKSDYNECFSHHCGQLQKKKSRLGEKNIYTYTLVSERKAANLKAQITVLGILNTLWRVWSAPQKPLFQRVCRQMSVLKPQINCRVLESGQRCTRIQSKDSKQDFIEVPKQCKLRCNFFLVPVSYNCKCSICINIFYF